MCDWFMSINVKSKYGKFRRFGRICSQNFSQVRNYKQQTCLKITDLIEVKETSFFVAPRCIPTQKIQKICWYIRVLGLSKFCLIHKSVSRPSFEFLDMNLVVLVTIFSSIKLFVKIHQIQHKIQKNLVEN